MKAVAGSGAGSGAGQQNKYSHQTYQGHHINHNYNHAHLGPSAALLDKVRALDALPRLGELRTLDLRGNDIRVSIVIS